LSINLSVGTVFRWNNFPGPRYGAGDKARWFICVGFTDTFSQIALVYSYTTTTQLQHFKPGGIRYPHPHHVFKCSQYNCFEKDCAIDFDESPYPIKETILKKYANDIEIKGELEEQTMRMIYDKTVNSNKITRRVKLDIHQSFNQLEITGLQKPK